MGRRASTSTRYFLRKLSPTESAVLAAAGDGDIVAGWHQVLATYQALHALGYRNDQDVSCFIDNVNQIKSPPL
jgi:hypothetical protein